MATSTAKIGKLIDKMFDLREDKRALESKIGDIELQYKDTEEELQKILEAEGLEKATGQRATASISTSLVGNVLDWEALNRFIKRTGNFQLYQRRLSDPAFRELLEQKGAVPGVQPFHKKRLNLVTRKESA